MAFELSDAIGYLSEVTQEEAGRFVAPAGELAIGSGLLYQGVPFVIFNAANSSIDVREGTVLVLTHECDLDQGNDKIFNSDVLFAPVVKFETVFQEIRGRRSEPETKGYVGDLARGRISQLFYIPPWEPWPNGGVVFFNRISNTHLMVFRRDSVEPVGALTGHGYRRLQERLSNHLIRPKDDRLPLTEL